MQKFIILQIILEYYIRILYYIILEHIIIKLNTKYLTSNVKCYFFKKNNNMISKISI